MLACFGVCVGVCVCVCRGRAVGSFHVPYRNSVMTSILRDSLGGNCRTVFVVTLNTEVTPPSCLLQATTDWLPSHVLPYSSEAGSIVHPW